MKQRITLLLGAGAAKPWGGKLTNELTQALIQKDKKKTKSGKKLSEFLINTLAKYHNSSSDIVNFEMLLYIMELMYEYYYEKNHPNPPHFRPDAPAIFNLIPEIDEEIPELEETYSDDKDIFFKKGRFVIDAIYYYLDFIYWQISEYSSNFLKENVNVNSKLSDFITALNNKSILRIYSLNYDNILRDIKDMPTFFNGFKGANDDKQRYDYKDIINATDKSIFYNLHGSFNYKSLSISDASDDGSLFTYQLGYSKDSMMPSISMEGFTVNDEHKRRLVNSPVITGQQKLLHTLVEPINAFFHSFRYDCLNSDLFISVGYSYTDGHINDCILNGIAANKNQKILNVTFEKYLEGNPFDTNEYLTFFKNILDNSGRYNFFQTTGKDGWLYSRNKKEIIYYNGFEAFLDKKTEILNLLRKESLQP